MKFDSGDTSLVNWLRRAGHKGAVLQDSMAYDKGKTARLAKLKELINFPGNEALYIPGDEFTLDNTSIKKLGFKKYCFRIAPRQKFAGKFEVIKKYGLTVKQILNFLRKFNQPPHLYEIRVTRYTDSVKFSAIILVNRTGIVGEAVRGELYHLTYARPLSKGQKIVSFFLDTKSKSFLFNSKDLYIKHHIKNILGHLLVKNKNAHKKLVEAGFKLVNNYIAGYYEYVGGDKDGVFTDMNNKEITTNLKIKTNFITTWLNPKSVLSGTPIQSQKGIIIGKAQWVGDNNIETFIKGNILVCERTTADYLPAMKKAKAIITCNGGIMSHAAIIARELKIPGITAVVQAKQRIHTGNILTLNLKTGQVIIN